MARTRKPPRPRGFPRALRSDERGVSTVVGYAIGLGIATLLITGLLASVGTFIVDQRESTARTELGVIGQQLAADIRVTDTLVRTGGASPAAVSYRQDLPDRTAGGGYVVSVNPSSCGCIVLTSDDPDVRVDVRVTTRATLAASRFSGGDVRVEYDAGTGALEVSAADG